MFSRIITLGASMVLLMFYLNCKISMLQAALSITAIWLIEIVSSRISLKSKDCLPPGPIGLPLLGSLPWVIMKSQEGYSLDLHKKYGGIATIKMGKVKNIIVTDYKAIKEMSINQKFQGRPRVGVLNEVGKGYGIIDSEGPLWKHQRRFMIHTFRDAGMGKLHMVDKIVNEIVSIIDIIKQSNGQPISIDSLLEKSTYNVLLGLAFGKSLEYDDPELLELISRLNESVNVAEKLVSTLLFPWLRPFLYKYSRIMHDNYKYFKNLAGKYIDEHKSDFDEDNPRDLIDLFLVEMKNQDHSNFEYTQTFTIEQLQTLIIDLIFAGTETSSTTIRWAIYYMIQNPHIQKKVQEEIHDVVGSSRIPTMDDKSRLPYTLATLQEVERLASVVPMSLPRSNEKAAKFMGYIFPERSMTTLSIFAVHRDPKLWENPEKFDPMRFIKDSKVERPPHLMSFGNGRRSCAGEALAKMEIFLLFTMLMQSFTFTSDCKMEDLKISSAIIRSPEPFLVRAHHHN